MNRILLGLTAMLIATAAYPMGERVRRDYGRLLCHQCRLEPVGTSPMLVSTVELVDFVRTEGLTPQFKSGETVTVCDGIGCVVLVFRLPGRWIALTSVYSDLRTPYLNKRRLDAGEPQAPTPYVESAPLMPSVAYYETTDYYHANGSYITSSDPVFYGWGPPVVSGCWLFCDRIK